jgi:tetratricopeptide (TPR) repeat protein
VAFQRSLELVPGYAPAQTGLASVYYSRHEFSRALVLAQAVYEVNFRNEQARLIAADSHLSMGNYDEAEEIYEELAGSGSTAPYLARLASLADLKGDPEEALALMRRAAGSALRSGGTRETTAWYLLRVGDLYFNRGETRMAGEFYEASLRVFDRYPLALSGLGKVSAAGREYEKAITYYQQAVEVVPQPEFHAALGDLYMLLERPDLASIQYDTVVYIGKLAALNEQVYNRQLANFYSDHDIHVQEALQLALAELEVRRDIYGYDAAAWAYYKNGKFTEAQSMIDRALSLGTRDAGLYYHAGMIAQALHRDEEARSFLEEALAINPYFSVLSAGEARAMLQSLRQAAAR